MPAAATAAALSLTCPNAPKSTFPIERFIARPIIIVSNVPEAPTSIPATIRTLFSSSNPVAAAARPVNAFRSEITTGMSAPPIGSTNSTPNSAAPAAIAHSNHCSSAPATITAPATTHAPSNSAFPICWPGYVIGRPRISSWSLANATIEPANEIDPISAERTIAVLMSRCRPPGAGARRWNSANEMSAAAPPPTPLNSATICGIAVIFTRRAATSPKPPPMTIPTAISQ